MRQPKASPTRLTQNSRDQARLRAIKAPRQQRPPRPAAACMIEYGGRRRGDLGPKYRDEALAPGRQGIRAGRELNPACGSAASIETPSAGLWQCSVTFLPKVPRRSRGICSLGAFVVACTGAMSAHRVGLMRRSCRGRRTRQRHSGFLRNLGDPERFHATISGSGDRTMHPWPAVCVLGRQERNDKRNAWYRHAKATKHGERDAGSRTSP